MIEQARYVFFQSLVDYVPVEPGHKQDICKGQPEQSTLDVLVATTNNVINGQVLAIFVSYFLFCQIHDYLDSDWLAVLPLPENAKEQRVLSFKSQGSNTQLNPIVSSNPPKPFETSGLFMK